MVSGPNFVGPVVRSRTGLQERPVAIWGTDRQRRRSPGSGPQAAPARIRRPVVYPGGGSGPLSDRGGIIAPNRWAAFEPAIDRIVDPRRRVARGGASTEPAKGGEGKKYQTRRQVKTEQTSRPTLPAAPRRTRHGCLKRGNVKRWPDLFDAEAKFSVAGDVLRGRFPGKFKGRPECAHRSTFLGRRLFVSRCVTAGGRARQRHLSARVWK